MTLSLAPALLSVVVLVFGAVVVLLFTARLARDSAALTAVGAVTLIAAIVPVANNNPSLVMSVVAPLLVGLIAMLLLPSTELQDDSQRPEVAALILLGTGGAVTLATADELLSAAIGLETLSLAAAVLVALGRGTRPVEAAFKYFMLGAISFAALIYGIGLIFVATGSLSWPTLQTMDRTYSGLWVAGVALVGLGLAYKLAVVPTHWGSLDAYTASAPGAAGFVMAASKIAAVFAIGKLAVGAAVPMAPILVIVGIVSIVWGMFGALAQRELRRMLAYSTVLNAGFMVLALGCGELGRTAAIYYAVIYGLTVLLVFAALSGRGAEPVSFDQISSLGLTRGRVIALCVGLLSLAGVPPLPGFWAKLAVLQAAIATVGWVPAVIAAIGGVAGALYYLRPLPDLLPSLARPSEPAERGAGPGLVLAGFLVALLVVAPGAAYALSKLSGG
ncbi:MAG: proton-conducting transporter membrane subunit [Chloroflexota bacterium]